MSPLEACLLVACLFLPWVWLVRHLLEREDDPRYLRTVGIVIVREGALQGHSPPIGEYRGRPIWGTVIFKGACYHFDRVARAREKEYIGGGELYLEPGLIYVAQQAG